MISKLYKFIRSNKVLNIIFFSKFSKKFFQYIELIIWGGRIRRKVANTFLDLQYKSKFRRDNYFTEEPPHFTDFERYENLFKRDSDYHTLMRGYLAEDIIKKGDKLLDIGTGSGFFAKKFFSYKCSVVDAIDIDKDAIGYAKKYNYSKNINYFLQDAVNEPFPRTDYDIIVWDGAIGHFKSETTNLMLEKILSSLNDDGIFVGSESLGSNEGVDHLQFWESIDDLKRMFQKYFKYVYLREATYPINNYNVFQRREAYWKCSNSNLFKNKNFNNWS